MPFAAPVAVQVSPNGLLRAEDYLPDQGWGEVAESATAPFTAALTRVDPLRRLTDPNFVQTTWEDEDGNQWPGTRHPKQQEAGESVARARWLFWGNQTGKTTFGGQEWAKLALGRHDYQNVYNLVRKPPCVLWASALTWELWENILLPELLAWIPKERIVHAPPPFKKSTLRAIWVRADNGKISRIVGKAAQQGVDLYQSARIDGFWGDEEHPRAIRMEVLPRLMRYGGVELYTMTPLKGLTWVYHDVYVPWKQGRSAPEAVYISHAGIADNPGIPDAERERLRSELAHNPSQLAAREHGLFIRPEGVVLPFDPDKHYFDVPDEHALTRILATSRLWCGIDFGAWRFAFIVGAVDRDGHLRVIAKLFLQRVPTSEQARQIHELLAALDAPGNTLIAGDCAAAQSILDMNDELRKLGSPYGVAATTMEEKHRIPGTDRMVKLLHNRALSFRRGMDEDQVWHLGWNAGSSGQPVMGCRLMWEVDNWRYPKPAEAKAGQEEKAQAQDPDDNTADGADCLAALRYLVMTWYAGLAPVEDMAPDPWSQEALRAEEEWRAYDRPAPRPAALKLKGRGKRPPRR